MNLDFRQTRRMYLAGTVAFPTPFPCAGGISIEDGSLQRTPNGERQRASFVVAQESGLEHVTIRVVFKEEVAAMFFPGTWTDTDRGRVFQFAGQDGVNDLEKGEWFLKPDIDTEVISKRLHIDIRRRDSGARGIVFVPKSGLVLTDHEYIGTAGDTSSLKNGCDPRYYTETAGDISSLKMGCDPRYYTETAGDISLLNFGCDPYK